MEIRKAKEKEFHNAAFREHTREKADKYYRIWGRTMAFYRDYVSARCTGKSILEYGCGTKSEASFLSARGASVTGIDISDVAIEHAREAARREGLRGVNYEVMDGESLSYRDHSFDIVCGSGILHHLNVRRAFSELRRVLAPQGEAIFIEPLGHNPLINLYRKVTPGMRTAGESPLLISDLEMARRYFSLVDIHYFNLTTLLAVPLRNWPGFGCLLRGLERTDDFVFHCVPIARRLAWIAVLVLREPIA